MLNHTLLLTTCLLSSSMCFADTIEIQPTQSGYLYHSFLCCGFNTYSNTSDGSVWISECSTSPFGCSSADLAAVWRWDLGQVGQATINSAYIDFHVSSQTCNSSTTVSFDAITGSMNTTQALAMHNNPAGSYMGNVASDVDVSNSMMMSALKAGGLGALFDTPSCNITMSGKFAPTLVVDYTPQDDLCPADISGDGVVGVVDLLSVIKYWGSTNAEADLNASGLVDTGDILMVIDFWGPCNS